MSTNQAPDLPEVADILAKLGTSSAMKDYIAKRLAKARPTGTSLTAEDVAKISAYRDEWVSIARETASAHRQNAEKAVRMMYRQAGLPRPRVTEWHASPLAGALAALQAEEAKDASVTVPVYNKLFPLVDTAIRKKAAGSLVSRVESDLLDAVCKRNHIAPLVAAEIVDRILSPDTTPVHHSVSGGVPAVPSSPIETVVCDAAVFSMHDAGRMGYYDYFRRAAGVSEASRIDGLILMARSAGWFWPRKGRIILTERPSKISLDAEDRLHSATELAIEYPDGFGLCAWHGVRIPHDAIFQTAEVPWDYVVAKTTDKLVAEAIAEVKALAWAGGKEESEEYRAALATKRLGGVEAVAEMCT